MDEMQLSMDKLQLRGWNLNRVFNIRSGHLHADAFLVSSVKLPNLQLKTRSKQLLGYLPLDSALPELSFPNRRDCVNKIVQTILKKYNLQTWVDNYCRKTLNVNKTLKLTLTKDIRYSTLFSFANNCVSSLLAGTITGYKLGCFLYIFL